MASLSTCSPGQVKVDLDPTIVTERLVLSRLSRDDVDDLAAMLLKPELYQYIDGAPDSPADAEARVERWLGGSADPDVLWINYVARRRDDGRFVGLAQATVLGRPTHASARARSPTSSIRRSSGAASARR